MAHEMMHLVDSTNRHANKMGILGKWWTEASIRMFDIKENNLRRQFSRFQLLGHGVSNIRIHSHIRVYTHLYINSI